MSKWDFPSNSPGTCSVRQNFDMLCGYCGSTEFRLAELHIFETRFDPEGMPQGHACDVMMRCVDCGARDVFGVAISIDEYLNFPAKWRNLKDDRTARFIPGYKVYYYKVTSQGLKEIKLPNNFMDVTKTYGLISKGRIKARSE